MPAREHSDTVAMQHEERRIHEVVVKQKNGELRLEKRGTSEYADDD